MTFLPKISARVFHASRGIYGLLTHSGESTAQLAGSFRHQAKAPSDFPVVGDYVNLDEHGLIEGLQPRRTCFSRRAAGEKAEEQVLAANVDLALLVCGLDGDFNLRRLERYLVLAHSSGAEPVVVLNKSDLNPDDLPDKLAAAREVAAGVPVILSSTRAENGLDAVKTLLEKGKTAVLLGSSGAGKSSISNGLLLREELRTTAVRESDSRGRHTTTHRELFELPGGAYLIDTPGLREIQLWTTEDSLQAAFSDIAELAASCRFRNCRHDGEPGCAVVGVVDEARLQSMTMLTAEVRRMGKAEMKQIHKDLRARFKVFGRR
ncbi:MAG: ribosome small subunit-dependent GTPase A [Bryobacteraceae bacterium]|nr:ribosome small subunit-dependent GTPase A [Bryobacteraceae bacterium]